MRAHCLFWHEAEVSSELIWSHWIFNSLIYPYRDKFISHVSSKHAVWHLYCCDVTIICREESWFCEKMKIEYFSRFYAPPQKVAGYYVIPSELLSFCPSVRQRLNIRVRSITLIPFDIISRNLVQM